MTDYATKMRRKASDLLKASGAKHAAYGLSYKNKNMFGLYSIREEIAEDPEEIKLFFDDESFDFWSDELIKEYNDADIDISCIYAIHARP